MSVATGISRSNLAFANLVWPRISPALPGGRIVPVETVTDSGMAQMLDMYAGVDMWWVVSDSMYPIASRVQFGPTAWDTFTIRYRTRGGGRTEYQKRSGAITSGALYPVLTVQAYVTKGEEPRLLSVAGANTKHLYEVAAANEGQRRVNPQDGNEFIWIDWDQLDKDKCMIWRAE